MPTMYKTLCLGSEQNRKGPCSGGVEGLARGGRQ